MSDEEEDLFEPRIKRKKYIPETDSETISETKSLEGEPDGCPICFEDFDNSGEHRICCLRCGHLFGLSCISRWIKAANKDAKCPKCNAKSVMNDIRVLYFKAIHVNDTTERDNLIKQLEVERCEKNNILKELETLRFRYSVIVKENNELHEHIKMRDSTLNQFPNDPNKHNQISQGYSLVYTWPFPKDIKCRVMVPNVGRKTILVAVPIIDGPFSGMEAIKQFDLEMKQWNKLTPPIHKGIIHDLSLHTDMEQGYLASAGDDKQLVVSSIYTGQKIFSWICPTKVYSCCWASNNNNGFGIFAGLETGKILLYDLRMPGRHIEEFPITHNPFPRVQSMSYVPRKVGSNQTFPGGLIVGQINSVSFLAESLTENLPVNDPIQETSESNLIDLTGQQQNQSSVNQASDWPAMKLQHLPLSGNLASISVLPQTTSFLASFRPNQSIKRVQHIISDIIIENDTNFRFALNRISAIYGGHTMSKLTRSSTFLANNIIMAIAPDEDTHGVVIWRADNGLVQQAIRPPKCSNKNLVMDVCSVGNDGRELAILSHVNPTTLWGQDDDWIYLTVQVAEASDVCAEIEEEIVKLSCRGTELSKIIQYSFQLCLYLSIIPEKSNFSVNDRAISFRLRKEHIACWSRLTYSKQKLPWIKIDFDRFQEEEEFSEDEQDFENEKANVNVNFVKPTQEQRLQHEKEREQLEAQEEWESFKELIKNPLVIYLLMLYIFQLAGAISIGLTTFSRKFDVPFFFMDVKDAKKSDSLIFEENVDRLLLVNLVSLLECLNILFHIEKHLPMFSQFHRAFVRNFVFFVAIWPHKTLQTDDSIGYLFLFWSFWDFIRYIRLILSTLGEQSGFINYVSHTIWIILLPVSTMTEGWLLLISSSFISESQSFSLNMPNIFNISFSMSHFIYLYIIFSGFYILRKTEEKYFERRKVIGPIPRKGAPEWSGLKGILGSPFIDYIKQTKNQNKHPLTKKEKLLQKIHNFNESKDNNRILF